MDDERIEHERLDHCLWYLVLVVMLIRMLVVWIAFDTHPAFEDSIVEKR